MIRKGVQRRERPVARLDQFFLFVRRKIGREGHQALLEKRVDRARRRDRELGEKFDRFLQILLPLGEQRRHRAQPRRRGPGAILRRVVLLFQEGKNPVAAFANVGLGIAAGGMPDAIVEGRVLELRAEEDPIDPLVLRPVCRRHRVHLVEQRADMLRAFRDSSSANNPSGDRPRYAVRHRCSAPGIVHYASRSNRPPVCAARQPRPVLARSRPVSRRALCLKYPAWSVRESAHSQPARPRPSKLSQRQAYCSQRGP